jgi:hypothetical protein
MADICTVHEDPDGAGHAVIVGVSGLTVSWVSEGFTKQPATSSNATVVTATPTWLTRPRLVIPTTSS